jgi:NADH-quinone oxidoreductase subunit J
VLELGLFAFFSLVAVISSLVVISHRNPVHSTLSLVVTLIATAALFVMLGAPFLGALQVLVYAGAIVVLFLFVIMLLNLQREKADRNSGRVWRNAVATAFAFLLTGILGRLFWDAYRDRPEPPLREEFVALKPLARELLVDQMLPFQLAGVLLLVAVVVVSWVAERARHSGAKEESE